MVTQGIHVHVHAYTCICIVKDDTMIFKETGRILRALCDNPPPVLIMQIDLPSAHIEIYIHMFTIHHVCVI